MRKLRAILFAGVLILSLVLSGFASAAELPNQLRVLEQEALMGTKLRGLVRLPDTAEAVGKDVFRDTGLYALEIPAGVTALDDQGLEGQAAAYALVKGENTPVAGLRGVRYLFFSGDAAPQDTPAGTVPYPSAGLISDGLFYYALEDAGDDQATATLLCAVDNLLVPEDVVIAATVQGVRVTRVANDAFIGCPQIRSISLPEHTLTAYDAFSSCPDAIVTYRFDEYVLKVWAGGAVTGMTERLLDAFWQAHPEYSAWTYEVCEMSESEVPSVLTEYPDALVDVYSFAQDQLAVLVHAGQMDAVAGGYAAEIRSGNDASAVDAATLSGRLYAYPITSDNGYFLYYDKSVVRHPETLEGVLADCEAAGRAFCAELTSGWYNVMFFFGAGCELEYTVGSDGSFTGSSITVASENGLAALKAMIAAAQSPAFVNTSSASEIPEMAAVVSGTWDAQNVYRLFGENAAAAKLPIAGGFQLGSFGGYKLLGVKNNGSAERLALAHDVAYYLSGKDAQIMRQNEAGWIASRPAARAAASSAWYESALGAQAAFAVPQGQYPGSYWGIAEELGASVISGSLNDLTDAQLMNVLQRYQADLASLAR